VRVRERDLTAYARIRNAALDGFAAQGVSATTIRGVAAAAGVSPGLVQHHFATKAALRESVNQYVLEIVAEAFEELGRATPSQELLNELGERITETVRDHRMAALYVARSVAEGDEAALQLFDALCAVSAQQIKRFQEDGLMRDDADIAWATVQPIVMILGSVLLEPGLSRNLPEPFYDGLWRWNEAQTEAYRQGYLKKP
jgi:AcrR family transcriptional regulator